MRGADRGLAHVEGVGVAVLEAVVDQEVAVVVDAVADLPHDPPLQVRVPARSALRVLVVAVVKRDGPVAVRVDEAERVGRFELEPRQRVVGPARGFTDEEGEAAVLAGRGVVELA